MKHYTFRIALILLLMRSSVHGVIVTENITAHSVTPGEPMFGVNLDGVVPLQIQGITGCNAGLISDRHLITAAHCFDIEIDNVIDFPPDTEVTALFELPTGVETWSFLPTDIQLVDDWWDNFGDLAIITLPDDAPPDVPRYPLYRGTAEVGAEIVVVGYGVTGTGKGGNTNSPEQKIAGLNRYEAIGEQLPPPLPEFLQGGTLVYDFDNGQPENDSLALLGIDSDFGFAQHEVKSTIGDSGAPTFWNGAIVGLTSFGHRPAEGDIDGVENRTFGELSYDTRVSRWADFIAAATDGAAVFVDDPPGQPGDFDGDGSLALQDLNELIRQSLTRGPKMHFDVNRDTHVDQADVTTWVVALANTWLGDVDLDGRFDSTDLATIASFGRYETDKAALWQHGDWNADGRFTSDDLVRALADGVYEQGPRAAASAVPEPCAALLLALGMLGLSLYQRAIC